MEIRTYKESDYVEIADLFHGSVHSIGDEHYTKEELNAWSPTPPDYDKWKQKLRKSNPFIAFENGKIVGFIELEENGHIDCLYVHKNHQRKGIAGQLYGHVCIIAKEHGVAQLNVEASKVAKSFFEKRGFEVLGENTVVINGQSLLNYKMVGSVQP